jgi:hypothetical protein
MKHVQRSLLKFISRTVLVFFLVVGIILNHFLFFPTKSLATASAPIEQQILILHKPQTVGGTAQGIAYVDTARYTGATYYVEVVAQVTSGTGSVDFVYGAGTGSTPSGGSTVTINNITATSYTRYRSSSFSLTTGNVYVNNFTGTGISVTDAKIIIVQSDATKLTDTQTQIDVGANTTSTNTTDVRPGGIPHLWTYDSTKYDGTVTVYFEATLSSAGAGTTAFASLYSSTGSTCGTQVSGSEVSITGTTNQRVRSSGITLTTGTPIPRVYVLPLVRKLPIYEMLMLLLIRLHQEE